MNRSNRSKGSTALSVRTIGLVGHRASGKTTLAEAILAAGGAVRRAGSVLEGTALLDHTSEERRRKMSLWPAVAWVPWEDHEVHLIDTPGLEVSAYARRLALQGTDLLLVCVEAKEPLADDTSHLLHEARHDPRRTVVVVTKTTASTSPEALLAAVGEASGSARAVALTVPFVDDEGQLAGVVDVLRQRVLRYDEGGTGAFSPEPVPSRLAGVVAAAHEQLQEAVAMADDSLLEHYLEFLELDEAQVWQGLVTGMDRGEVVPVLFTAAGDGIGAAPLLDAVVRLTPDPAGWVPAASEGAAPGFVAQWVSSGLDQDGEPYRVLRVWHGQPPRKGAWRNARCGEQAKIRKLYRLRGPRRAQAKFQGPGALIATWEPLPGRPGDVFTDGPAIPWQAPVPPPMMAWRELRSAVDLAPALALLNEVDPALQVQPVDGGASVAASTTFDLDQAVRLLRQRLGVDIQVSLPEVVDGVSVAAPSPAVEGHHEIGEDWDREAYGHVVLRVEPGEVATGITFDNQADPEDLPDKFVAGVREGIARAAAEGLDGRVIDALHVVLMEGDYDILASQPEHFAVAAGLALHKAVAAAPPRALVAWQRVEVHVPVDALGKVLNQLPGLGGRVANVDVGEHSAKVSVDCPERLVLELEPRLRAMTAGRGWFLPGARQLVADPLAEGVDRA